MGSNTLNRIVTNSVGHAVPQFVEALHYKPEGPGWNFSLT